MSEPAPTTEALRAHVAWLMWCLDQGYVSAEDRAVLEEASRRQGEPANWLLDDPAKVDEVLDQAKSLSRQGKPVCVNVILQKTDFREGSISI